MSTTPDKLVERYLKHLEVELDDLPRDRRREIVDEIAGHIAEARFGFEHETEADVRNILDGLGDPADIADDARERFDVRPTSTAAPYKPGWIEIGALVMLLVGGLILPVVGWFVGVVLLWVSNAWNVRDKVIGTVFVPGGLGLSIFLLVAGLSSAGGGSGCQGEILPGSGREYDCFGASAPDSTSFMDVVATGFLIALVVAPIITTAYLTYRLRRHSPVAAA
jgi:uncharacterized membrane protein